MEIYKTCNKCGETKLLISSNFAIRLDGKDGFRNICRKCVNEKYNINNEKKKLEKIIELKNEFKDIDWNKYKYIETIQAMECFIYFALELKSMGIEMVGDYTGSKNRIRVKVNEIIIFRSPTNLKNTLNSIRKFKESIENNGDFFLEFTSITDNGFLVAKIQTFDGGIIEMFFNNYCQFVKGRNDFINKVKELGIQLDSPYLGRENKIDYRIDQAIFKERKINDFRKTYDSIRKFKNTLKTEGDTFIRFSKQENNKLYAEIRENRFKEIIEIPLSLYNYNSQGFLMARKEYYEKEKNGEIEFLEPFSSVNKKIKIRMKCGCIHYVQPLVAINHSGFCPLCCMKGSRNPNWKGGIAPLKVFFREKTKEWKENIMKKSNYKCEISGKRADEVHHLYSFNTLVFETLEELNIDINEDLSIYSDEELELMGNEFIKKHDSLQGVALSSEIHKKFHKIYGYGYNTPEQFEEFKKICECS